MGYAQNKNNRRLAQLYVNLSAMAVQLSSEMHEARKYFASACDYYDSGNYYLGRTAIDEMNIHIEIHDDLQPSESDCRFDIDALLAEIFIG